MIRDNDNYMVIVPVYNGADTIRSFYNELPKKFISKIIFVNDGSTDNSRVILRKLKCQVIEHHRNFGKGRALRTGIDFAQKKGQERAITMDVDLQHPPEYLENFITDSNDKIILGTRDFSSKMPIHRRFSNFFTSLLLSIRTNTLIRDSQCGFRSYPVNQLGNINFREDGFQFESEILIKAILAGTQIQHRSIPTIYSESQQTRIRPAKDTYNFILLWFRSFFWS
jgi:glycosyltransferase involved in cell wall biosynthesis